MANTMPKTPRDVLLAIIAKLYKILTDYISGSGSTEETDKFMHSVKELLKKEGFQ